MHSSMENPNICSNNRQLLILRKSQAYTLSGNTNKINIRECGANMSMAVMGNENTIYVDSSQIVLNVNGNGNIFCIKNSKIKIGINGNGNQIKIQDQQNSRSASQVTKLYNNGFGNIFPQTGVQEVGRIAGRIQARNNIIANTHNSNYFSNGLIGNTNVNRNQLIFNSSNNINANRQILRNNHRILSHQIPGNRLQQLPVREIRRDQQVVQPNQDIQFESWIPPVNPQWLNPEELVRLPQTKHTGPSSQCTICWEKVQGGDSVIFLFCFHSFHSHCCRQWLGKIAKCPICQIDIREQIKKMESFEQNPDSFQIYS